MLTPVCLLYTSYWSGATKQENPRSVVKQAEIGTLNKSGLESYKFSAGDTETTTLDSFENPSKRTTSAIDLTSGGTNKATYETEYEYDAVSYTHLFRLS